MSFRQQNRSQSCAAHAPSWLLTALALVALVSSSSFAGSAQTTNTSRPRRATTSSSTNRRPQPTITTPRTTAPTTSTNTSTPPATKTNAPQRQTTPTSTPPPTQATPTPTPAGEEIGDDEIVRVDTNVVNLNVRVIDRDNRPVADVRKEDFRVVEDGVPQIIQFFTRAEVPISYGLVVDNSGSLRQQLQQVQEAGKTIINSNKPGDETFLVRFVSSDKIETLQDFTADKDLLNDAIETLYTEGGQTAITDAVLLSAERVANYKKGDALNDRRRRALIVVTDGEDRASYYKQQDLFSRLREDDVQIYVIGFVNELDANGGLIRKSSKEKAVSFINKLATETGGRAFFPASTAELPGIADEITKDLRTQYVIGYYPTNKARDGSYRAIRVQIADNNGGGGAAKRDKRIAITRPGRTAPRGGGDASTNGNAPAARGTTNNIPPIRRP